MRRWCCLKQDFKTLYTWIPEGFAKVGEELTLKGQGPSPWRVVNVGKSDAKPKKKSKPLQAFIEHVGVCIPLSPEQFDKLNAMDYLHYIEPRLKDAGAYDIRYDGHFGANLFLRVAAQGDIQRVKKALSKLLKEYTYKLDWSKEDQEWVGLCAEFPSLSFLDRRAECAIAGIQQLVEEAEKDIEDETL